MLTLIETAVLVIHREKISACSVVILPLWFEIKIEGAEASNLLIHPLLHDWQTFPTVSELRGCGGLFDPIVTISASIRNGSIIWLSNPSAFSSHRGKTCSFDGGLVVVEQNQH